MAFSTPFLQSQPLALLIAGPAGVVIIVAAILWIIISRAQFKQKLKMLYTHSDRLTGFKTRYSASSLQRRSALIEKIAHKYGPEIIPLIQADELWVSRLQSTHRVKDFHRVLNLAPTKGLFVCFLISLEKKSLAPRLIKWLEDTGDLLYMRRLALAGVGEPFDGQEAFQIFGDKLDEIREMTGDPEWPSRYFATKVLLFDEDERSSRAMWDAFSDPHPLIRKTAAVEFQTGERESLYARLFELAVDDPVTEVRQAAWQRIYREYKDLHGIDAVKLDDEQILHVLDLLHTNSQEDQAFALQFLDSKNLELRFSAASFLARCGTLKRLCLAVDFSDRNLYERNLDLLQKAGEVNVTAFLSAVRETHNPAPLSICASILAKNGNPAYITTLARRVFSQFDNKSEQKELYQSTVLCVSERGPEDALKLMNREILKWRDDIGLTDILLPALPARGATIFTETLMTLFRDPEFLTRYTLRDAWLRMARPAVIESLFEILKSDRSVYHHKVRIEAVKLLGEMELPYCLQSLLEYMPVLPVEEAKEFAKVLAKYPQDMFKQKVLRLLDGPDAKVRAAIIAALSASGDKEYLKPIRNALKDADPDVRIAAVWSLVDYEDLRTLNQTVDMLRDPAERVREAVARALGSYGSDQTLKHLQAILVDENEVIQVKRAAVHGLAVSTSEKAIDALVEKVDRDDELTDDITTALGGKQSKKEITYLVERFKDASPALRASITAAFKGMREAGEESIVELMKEDIPSLRPYIGEILDNTGHIEARIRMLNHRDPAMRRQAAEFLTLVGTQSAFRGIVLAARDPDEEVRVRVIRALEKLETKKGHEILQALENDPDAKVRKYTLWAMERLQAKAL